MSIHFIQLTGLRGLLTADSCAAQMAKTEFGIDAVDVVFQPFPTTFYFYEVWVADSFLSHVYPYSHVHSTLPNNQSSVGASLTALVKNSKISVPL